MRESRLLLRSSPFGNRRSAAGVAANSAANAVLSRGGSQSDAMAAGYKAASGAPGADQASIQAQAAVAAAPAAIKKALSGVKSVADQAALIKQWNAAQADPATAKIEQMTGKKVLITPDGLRLGNPNGNYDSDAKSYNVALAQAQDALKPAAPAAPAAPADPNAPAATGAAGTPDARFPSTDTTGATGASGGTAGTSSIFNPPAPADQARSDANAASADPNAPTDFGHQFLQMITSMPSQYQGAALSSYQAFQKLTPAEQQANIDAYMTEAKTAVQQQIDQDRTRSVQDYNMKQSMLQRSADSQQANYTRLISDDNLNKTTQVAAQNKALAQAIQHVTSTGFVQGTAGSGILARQSAVERANTAQTITDINTASDQKQASATDLLGQYLAANTMQKQSNTNTFNNGQTDLNQKETGDTTDLFLKLFNNSMADVQNDVNGNTSTGSIFGQKSTPPPPANTSASPFNVAPPPPTNSNAQPPPIIPNFTATNPTTGKKYSGAAAQRLTARLAKKK